jgi:hypothetical protein
MVGSFVARWVYDIASKRSDAAFEIVDIKDFNLPLLDEPVPAAMGAVGFSSSNPVFNRDREKIQGRYA